MLWELKKTGLLIFFLFLKQSMMLSLHCRLSDPENFVKLEGVFFIASTYFTAGRMDLTREAIGP